MTGLENIESILSPEIDYENSKHLCDNGKFPKEWHSLLRWILEMKKRNMKITAFNLISISKDVQVCSLYMKILNKIDKVKYENI